MTDEKCCGQPINCTRDCVFAAPASRYVGDHVHNNHGAVETEVMCPVPGACPKRPAAVDPPKPVNPKDGIGNTKLPLHLWPFSATAHGSLALLDGMLKYGRLNWRGTEVRASVYVGGRYCGMSRNGWRVRLRIPKVRAAPAGARPGLHRHPSGCRSRRQADRRP